MENWSVGLKGKSSVLQYFYPVKCHFLSSLCFRQSEVHKKYLYDALFHYLIGQALRYSM